MSASRGQHRVAPLDVEPLADGANDDERVRELEAEVELWQSRAAVERERFVRASFALQDAEDEVRALRAALGARRPERW